MHWILSKEPTTEDSPVVLIQELFQSKDFLDAECKESFLREKLSMSPEQIIQTAWTTIGQRENTLWAKVRKLRFTASNFGQIVTAVKHVLEKKTTECIQLGKKSTNPMGTCP